MIIVTGGAGFIGSNIVKGLNNRGISDIIVVDDMTQGIKFNNLVDCKITDYWDANDFLTLVKEQKSFSKEITCVFHEGACSTTTEWDGKFLLKNNYEYSKVLLHYCLEHQIPLIYASSAAVYGKGEVFKEDLKHEKPLNVYGYSKFLFDQLVRQIVPNNTSQIVGTRYFNVYGPREFHKGSMASVVLHNHNQIQEQGFVKLFQGNDGFGDGEQSRDFVYVDDVVNVNLWFMDNQHISGIYNVGSGRAQPFNDVGNAVIKWHKKGYIDYIPFPEHLKGCYQNFTQADISALRQVGFTAPFKTVAEGVQLYLDWLQRQ